MKKRETFKQAILLLTFFMSVSGLYAQSSIKGTITDETTGDGLIGANVIIVGTTQGTITDIDGNFSIDTDQSPPFDIEISYTGYTARTITITSSDQVVNTTLFEGILFGQDVVISASRKREKVQEAPASISVLSSRQLENSAQGSDPIRDLINVPGVQIQQQSAARMNIEMRGTSSIFGSATFPIKDYRSLVGPGLGTFQSEAAGLSRLDLERIEVVRGAGSALYGPGVTTGVIHFITKSAIDKPGTAIEVVGGELSTYGATIRHAGANEAKTFGYKINAAYNTGNEFELDGSEIDPDDGLVFRDKFVTTIIQPAVKDGIVDVTSPGTVLLTESDLNPDGDANIIQNDWFSTNIDATLEFRPSDDLSIIATAGRNQGSAVFYNDLGPGLSQQTEMYGQVRVQKGGFFAQAFYSDNDGGSMENPTFLYLTGNRTPVARIQSEAQVQYNLQTPSLLNADWTFGIDYRGVKNDTENLVYGRQEDDDDFRVLGGYVQGKFELGSKLDLVLAGRYDDFNFLDETSFSPRVALVYKASSRHTFRTSYNRATVPPSGLEINIDFPVNVPAAGILDFWLIGQKNIARSIGYFIVSCDN